MAERIEPIDLPEATQQRYLRYAVSVITARALPDVRDGLKPVQRRILYAMYNELGLAPPAKPVKSAKVVGEVMGKYHPHSDVAIYDAMVRMAQPFALRYTLVDGHGNFGAITGDNAAAFRYTEARLAPLGAELMETLAERTVPMRDNYDGTTREPWVLPTPAPLLLLNGSTGIAVGMATNIPPHNLKEVAKATVALIDDPELSVVQLLRWVKGPDFPTGGEVLASKEDLRRIYETGRGTIKVRGTYKVEETQARGQRLARTSIVIDSIPYGTTTAQVLAKVKELFEGKKLPQVVHISDQTTADDGVRLVLELKPGSDPVPIMAAVYRLTPLETSYGVNLTCLLPPAPGAAGAPAAAAPDGAAEADGDGAGVCFPHVCDLKQILRAWLDFRFQVITRSIEFRRERLRERIHVLEGFEKVLDGLDAAIKLIRAAEDRADARGKLGKKFALSEVQADAVLELRLYRLARLEVQKVEDELKEKRKEEARLTKLLQGTKPRWDLIKEQLDEFAARHGDRRRTRISSDDEAHQFDPTALIEKEDVHVVVTREGRIKRQKALDVERVRLRDDDELLAVLQGSTTAACAFFTNYGSAYVLPINDVPATAGFGEPIQKFFSFSDGERVVGAASLDLRLVPAEPDPGVFVATRQGNVVLVPLAPHREPSTRAGRKLVRLAEGDQVVAAEVPDRPGDRKADVLLATSSGLALRFPLADTPALSGAGKGRRGIQLAGKDELVGATTRPVLHLETTRGARDTVSRDAISRGAVGDEGVVMKQRGGFRRALPPPPELVELPQAAGQES